MPNPIKTVIFDYGCVISVVPAPEDYEPLRKAMGVEPATFNDLYWRHRDAYDLDTFTATAYWQKVGREAGREFSATQALDLAELDCGIWGRSNPVMEKWIETLHSRGVRIALISNISSHVAAYLRRNSPWLEYCQPACFSGELKLLKPDAAIFHACLNDLGQPATETLFIDDREVNVAAARAVGMNGIVFHSIVQLQTELEPYGLDESLTAAQTRAR